MEWKISDDRPIWSQLSEQLTEQIVSGILAPGAKMPAVRELAAGANVNPNTMQRALAELDSRGLTVTNRTAGRMVTENSMIIGSVRRELAEQKIAGFLEGMTVLGFSKEEMAEMIEAVLQEEKKGDLA